jgi:hypothetical protein
VVGGAVEGGVVDGGGDDVVVVTARPTRVAVVQLADISRTSATTSQGDDRRLAWTMNAVVFGPPLITRIQFGR